MVHSSKIDFDNILFISTNKSCREKNLTLDAFQNLFTLEIDKNNRSEGVGQGNASRKSSEENSTDFEEPEVHMGLVENSDED